MEWRAEYSVGIVEIDNHHKELLRLFSLIETAIVADQGWSAVHYGIVRTKQFAQFHFAFEEALMRLYGDANLEQHCEEHRQVLNRIASIERDSLQTCGKDDLVGFFRNWLVSHMRGADRAYAQHIFGGAKVAVPLDFKRSPRTATTKKRADLAVTPTSLPC